MRMRNGDNRETFREKGRVRKSDKKRHKRRREISREWE